MTQNTNKTMQKLEALIEQRCNCVPREIREAIDAHAEAAKLDGQVEELCYLRFAPKGDEAVMIHRRLAHLMRVKE